MPEFRKMFGFGDQVNRDQDMPIIQKFLSSFNRGNPKHVSLLSAICLALNAVRVSIDSSEIGIRILAQRPIYVDHTKSIVDQGNLHDQVVKIIKLVIGSNLDLLYNKLVPQNQNTTFEEVKQNIINFLVEDGRIVYQHSRGFFPSLQPACFLPDGKAIKGALHLMEWYQNFLVVELTRGSLHMLRKIYELEVDSLLISQVNWTRILSSLGGEAEYLSENKQGNILKTASLKIQKKVEAKKNFYYLIIITLRIDADGTHLVKLSLVGDVQLDPILNINTYQTIDRIASGLGVSSRDGIEVYQDLCQANVIPDNQKLESDLGHCKTCGLYPNEEFHSCNGVLERK